MSDGLAPDEDDRALVAAIPEGVIADRIARCMPLARSIAGRVTARFRALDYGVEYDDVLSGALFGAWKAAARFDPGKGGNVVTWAFQWMERYAVMAARTDAGLTTRGDGVRTDVLATESVGADDQDTDGVLLADPSAPDDQQITDAVVARRAVAGLPEQMRKVVYLTYWQDLGPKVIGQQVGMGRTTVTWTLDRAHRQMRTALVGDVDEAA